MFDTEDGPRAMRAEEALRVMRYSQEGERPTCTGVPAAGFGLSPFADYVQRSNSDVAAFGKDLR